MYDPNIQVAKFHLDELERSVKPLMKNRGSGMPSWTSPLITLVIVATAVSLAVGVFTIA